MDNVDYTILNVLHRNCRVSYEEVARLCGISAPAVKKRIIKLRKSGALGRYRVVLNCKSFGAAELLIRVYTRGIDSKNLRARDIGNHPSVEWLCRCSDGTYLVFALSVKTSDRTVLEDYLCSVEGVRSAVAMSLASRLPSQGFSGMPTKMERFVLRQLYENPVVSVRSLARILGKSPKGVSRAISQLTNSHLVFFSTRCHIPLVVLRVRKGADGDISDCVMKHIGRTCDRVWEGLTSSDGTEVYVFLAVDTLDEINKVVRLLRDSTINLEDVFIAEPRSYFSSVRDWALLKIIGNF